MKQFISVKDLNDVKKTVQEALRIKKKPFEYNELGRNKTIILLFFNSSLRTRLSTQKAALNLGMNIMTLDVNKDSWKLESELGVIMDGDKPEHLKEAIPVIGSYCDIIGVRAFANLKNREEDYEEKVINMFVDYSSVPVISLESATRHPLQSLADLMTIEEFKTVVRPKIVLTWAPHPLTLPQAVANSFCEWIQKTNCEFVVTHPKGYELPKTFTGKAKIEYNQLKAFKKAHFIYAKNWSAYNDYGKIISTDKDWMINTEKMQLTQNAYFMHCLPVRRNVIVSDEVIDSKNSIVRQQATNRIYSAQIILKKILSTSKFSK